MIPNISSTDATLEEDALAAAWLADRPILVGPDFGGVRAAAAALPKR